MKSCPICNRTFEDTFTFCLADGSLLNAPFDPHATLAIPEPRQTEPPPIEVPELQDEIKQEIPPTIVSPQPQRITEESVSTMSAHVPAFESLPSKSSPAQPVRKSKRLSLMIGALAMFLIIGVAVFILANRTDSTRQNPVNENTATVNTAAPDSANEKNSDSDNSEVSSDEETTSNAIAAKPAKSSINASTKKPHVHTSPSMNSNRKDNAVVTKPVRPNTNATAHPCANKSYPVCNPGERLGCNAATGNWECRRSPHQSQRRPRHSSYNVEPSQYPFVPRLALRKAGITTDTLRAMFR